MTITVPLSKFNTSHIWWAYSCFIILLAGVYFGSLSELMLEVDDARTFRDNAAVAQEWTYFFSPDKEVGSGRLTAYWLPLPLYEQQEWELYVGAVFLILLLAVMWKRVYAFDAWALWILMGLVPFALLTEGTVDALLAGPSRYLLAYALFDQGKVQEASEMLQRATQIKAQDPKAMYLRALILQREGKIEEALVLTQKAMRIKPLVELFYLASFCYNQLGQHDQAAAMLEEGDRRKGKMLGQYGQAAAMLEESVRRKGQTPNLATYKRLADYYSKSGRRSDAIKAYGAALQLAPHDVEARTNLAMQLFINGQVEEAITHTQRALQDKPTVHALFNLGLFYLSRGEIDKAITTYAQAVEQFGAARGEKIGAVHNLKNLANKGIQVEAVREIVETHWRQ
jgi:tetratricopeptide (TPR) repeat protein